MRSRQACDFQTSRIATTLEPNYNFDPPNPGSNKSVTLKTKGLYKQAATPVKESTCIQRLILQRGISLHNGPHTQRGKVTKNDFFEWW